MPSVGEATPRPKAWARRAAPATTSAESSPLVAIPSSSRCASAGWPERCSRPAASIAARGGSCGWSATAMRAKRSTSRGRPPATSATMPAWSAFSTRRRLLSTAGRKVASACSGWPRPSCTQASSTGCTSCTGPLRVRPRSRCSARSQRPDCASEPASSRLANVLSGRRRASRSASLRPSSRVARKARLSSSGWSGSALSAARRRSAAVAVSASDGGEAPGQIGAEGPADGRGAAHARAARAAAAGGEASAGGAGRKQCGREKNQPPRGTTMLHRRKPSSAARRAPPRAVLALVVVRPGHGRRNGYAGRGVSGRRGGAFERNARFGQKGGVGGGGHAGGEVRGRRGGGAKFGRNASFGQKGQGDGGDHAGRGARGGRDGRAVFGRNALFGQNGGGHAGRGRRARQRGGAAFGARCALRTKWRRPRHHRPRRASVACGQDRRTEGGRASWRTRTRCGRLWLSDRSFHFSSSPSEPLLSPSLPLR